MESSRRERIWPTGGGRGWPVGAELLETPPTCLNLSFNVTRIGHEAKVHEAEGVKKIYILATYLPSLEGGSVNMI